MKKIFTITTAILFFAACKNKSSSNTDTNRNLVTVDTAGLYNNNGSTDIGDKDAAIRTSDLQSGDNNAASKRKPNGTNKPTNNPASTSNNKSETTSQGNSNTATPSTTTAPVKDKRISNAAKGTAIGAGSGAVLGAVVSKNNTKGAIIGGVLGAGAGYIIGRAKDKKSGRVARQKAKRNKRRAAQRA
jgi:hypothetical protein